MNCSFWHFRVAFFSKDFSENPELFLFILIDMLSKCSLSLLFAVLHFITIIIIIIIIIIIRYNNTLCIGQERNVLSDLLYVRTNGRKTNKDD